MTARDKLIEILKNWAYEDGEGLEAVLMSDVCADLADTLIAAGVEIKQEVEEKK